MADYAPVDLTAAEQVEFELNGRRVSAPAGTMLVDAAYAHGVEVPIFCYEPRLGAAIGACRMCLVEIEGMRGLQTACSTPVQPDMVVRSDSDAARDGHDGVLEFLLENHPLDCPVCDKGGECPLQDRTYRFGPPRSRFVETKRHFPKPLDLSAMIALDRERCISCFRCVRFSQDVAEDGALIMEDRGAGSEIGTFTGDLYEGRFTGNVIDLCPVGALTSIPYRFVARPWDIANAPSVCGHCPVGCNVELTQREGGVARVTGRPDPNYEVEEGWLCDKGRFAYPGDWAPDAPVHARHPRREPLARRHAWRRPSRRPRSCSAAAGRVGVLVGPGATVEEGFLAQELAAGPLGGAPVQRLGIPGDGLAALRARPAAQLADIDGAGLVLIVGGDPANQQPVVELRVRKARRGGAKVVTVGPRPHALEALAGPDGRVRSVPGRLVEALAAGPAAGGRVGRRAVGRGRPRRRARRRRRARAARRRPRRPLPGARRRRQRRGPEGPRDPRLRRARGGRGGRDRHAADDPRRPDRRPRGLGVGLGARARAGPHRDRHPRLVADRLRDRGAAGRHPLRERGRLRGDERPRPAPAPGRGAAAEARRRAGSC